MAFIINGLLSDGGQQFFWFAWFTSLFKRIGNRFAENCATPVNQVAYTI